MKLANKNNMPTFQVEFSAANRKAIFKRINLAEYTENAS